MQHVDPPMQHPLIEVLLVSNNKFNNLLLTKIGTKQIGNTAHEICTVENFYCYPGPPHQYNCAALNFTVAKRGNTATGAF